MHESADSIWSGAANRAPVFRRGAFEVAIPDKSWTQASTAGPSQCAELSPQMNEGPTPLGTSPSRTALRAGIGPGPTSAARRYAAFGFLPGAGAGTNPDTRYCRASIVRPRSSVKDNPQFRKC